MFGFCFDVVLMLFWHCLPEISKAFPKKDIYLTAYVAQTPDSTGINRAFPISKCNLRFSCTYFLLQNSGIDIGDISGRKALRSRLQCRPFSWFLSNIYPELRSYSNTVAYGVVSSKLFLWFQDFQAFAECNIIKLKDQLPLISSKNWPLVIKSNSKKTGGRISPH